MNYNIYRVKYKKSMVLISAVVFCILISTAVNVAMAFVSVKDVYIGDTVSSLDFVEDPFSFIMELSAVIDMTAVVGYVISGVIIGAIAGVAIAVALCFCRSAVERRRDRNAEDIRICLAPVRPIIADGYAVASKKIPSISNKRNKGTLLLTTSTLEFYDKDYTEAQKNFLLKLSDIISVRSTTCLLFNNKITVMTTKASYTFRVPIGTARSWKKFIKAAI